PLSDPIRPAPVPMPPVDLQCRPTLHADLRSGDPLAAAVADPHRQRKPHRGDGRLQRPGRPGLLGSGPLTAQPSQGLQARLLPRLARWADDRLGTVKVVRKTLDKIFPDHWSFMLGEAALYCFIILIVTGVFLTFFYEASPDSTTYIGSYGPLRGVEMSRAYESAIRVSFDVRAGIVMRQAHHWAALLFLATI